MKLINRVLSAIEQGYGTAGNVARAIDATPRSVAARATELEHLGLIRCTGKISQAPKSGPQVKVYIAI